MRSYTAESLVADALHQFWARGYSATSMDDLVKATGVSRHGIYKTFGGKKQLFLASFETYQRRVVDPAFCDVETPDATLSTIAAYFEYQISLAEKTGLPGPGCLIANTTAETEPNNTEVISKIDAHNARLTNGFRNALGNETSAADTLEDLSQALLVFTTGLWTLSRATSDGDLLRRCAYIFLSMVKSELKT